LDSRVILSGSKPFAASDLKPYYVYQAHVTGAPGESLGVELSLAATIEERKKGFGFNFSCLTALRECRHVCETFPSAWRDLPPERRLIYENGSTINDFEECRKGTP
jgi:hypothetical protein